VRVEEAVLTASSTFGIFVRHERGHHLMVFGVLWIGEETMRTTLAIDDALLARAQELTGERKISVLVGEALKALIEREAARRLILLGGSDPDAEAPPRQRLESS
jgi:Arc/MetJ family transcription regulator